MRGLSRPSAGFDVKIHRIATEGSAVLTERTDVMIFGAVRSLQFWVCGVFEVRDGRITLWRDYFDFLRHRQGTASAALAAMAIPSLRRSLLADQPPGPVQLVERLRPAEQSVGGTNQLVAVLLPRHRRTRRRHQLRCRIDHFVVLPHAVVQLCREGVDRRGQRRP